MTFTSTYEPSSPDLSDAAAAGTQATVTKPRYRAPRELVGTLKTCTKCHREQDLSEFALKRGGRAASCRSCQKAHSDANYLRHREQRLADARERNDTVRNVLRAERDKYLSRCLCESCTGTVDLQVTGREGYEGESAHEVVAAAGSLERLMQALANSRVLCKPCMGNEYGGPLAQARRKMEEDAAQAPLVALP